MLDSIARIQRDAGDVEQALQTYQEALSLAQESGNSELEGRALENIGRFYRDTGQLTQALDFYQQLLVKAQAAADQNAEANALDNIARIQRESGKLNEALASYQTVLELAEEMGNAQLGLTAQTNIAKSYSSLSRYEEAAATYEKLLAAAKTAADRPLEATTLQNLGDLQRTSGDYAGVFQRYQEAMTIRQELGDQPAVAQLHVNIGDAYSDLGQFEQALPSYQEALAIYQSAALPDEQIATLNAIGATYHGMGAYEQAIASFKAAMARLTADIAPANAIDTYANLGKLYRAVRDYDAALTAYQQAVDQVRKSGDQAAEAKQLINLGVVHSDLGQYEDAQKEYEEAAALAATLQDEALRARALYSLGKVYRDTAQYELALEVLQEALAIQQRLGDHGAEAAILNNLGTIYLNLLQHEKALEPFQRAITAAETMRDSSAASEAYAGMGLAYESQGQLEQAIENYQKAIAVAGAQPLNLETYQRLIKLLWDAGRLGDVFTFMEKALAQTFLDGDGNPWINVHSKLAPELAEQEQGLRRELFGLRSAITAENEKLLAQRNQTLLTNLFNALDEKQNGYDEIVTRLRTQDPEYSAFLGLNPITLDEVRTQILDEHTTLIEYFILRKQAVAWVIDQERAVLVPLDITANELVNQITGFYDKVQERTAEVPEAASLYGRLFTPVRPFVRKNNLVIVSHGVLNYAPFAAFFDAQNGKYLVQTYAVSYAPSATLYKHLLNKRNTDSGRALVLGNGDDMLPFARQETRAVADALGVTPLMGDEATEAQLYAQAAQVDTLHVAASGKYQPLEPLFTYLALAAADTEDGKLEVREIFSKLDLSNANLVVLSGNQQGDLQRFHGGAEVAELAWAFTYAGAPSVLTSNWRVDDASIATFFEAFYRHLREKVTTAEALRLAQVEMLEQTDSASPYYWAAFSLNGDYQGEGEIPLIETSAEGVSAPVIGANSSPTDTATETSASALTTALNNLTDSVRLTNVFQVTEGSEIAGVKSTEITTTNPVTGTTNTIPIGDLTNGLCNNITLPLGLVLLADLFRRGFLRRKRSDEEKENPHE